MFESPMSRGPLRLFADRSHVAFARQVANRLGVPLADPDSPTENDSRMIIQFSNENIVPTLPASVRGCDCYIISTQSSPVSDHLIEVFLLIEALKTYEAARVTLVVPCFPYARSDKSEKQRRAIGLRTICRIIAQCGCDSVLVIDPHPDTFETYFPSGVVVSTLSADALFVRYVKQRMQDKLLAGVAPDYNSGRKITRFANSAGIDNIAFVNKRRDGDHEGSVKPVSMQGDVRGHHCVLRDDETMSGGTLVEIAEFCMAQGAIGVSALITHGVLSKRGAVERLNQATAISELVLTDTVPLSPDKIIPKMTRLSVVPMIATAIKLLHTGQSIAAYNKHLYEGTHPDLSEMLP